MPVARNVLRQVELGAWLARRLIIWKPSNRVIRLSVSNSPLARCERAVLCAFLSPMLYEITPKLEPSGGIQCYRNKWMLPQ
jgi:hypothetical protein